MNTTPDLLNRGLWGVMATPFTGESLAVDEQGLRNLIDLYREAGAQGLVLLGVFGEGAQLDDVESARIVEIALEHAPGMRLVLGLPDLKTDTAIARATRLLAVCGETKPALMVQVNTNDVDELAAHFAAIHEATGAGILVQDYPVASGVTIPNDALATVVNASPFVVGIKAEAPPTAVAIGRLTSLTTVPVFGGLGGLGLLDELAAGAAGAMTGFSYPEALVTVVEAFDRGGFTAAWEAYLPWMPLVNFEAQAKVGLAIRKSVFVERGLFENRAVRPPSQVMPDELIPLLSAQLAAVNEAGVL
ncbi:dihydrodipicolinate synthase family protein [Arthrobacter ramosus]|uniref:Dihydrodipicolinate synthase family protein n=1 Tax=Arthrobacter ramosus TaxID=1672 RepID=A0ABV5XT73_ARTRM|nr:dihydrodipicolinate synthase family protein [Arthrobacter ramosus]